MAEARSSWPVVLLLGLGVAMFAGGAAAMADPTESGRPWWHESGQQRVTGTVVSVDADDRTIVLDGLVSYRPVRAGIGTLLVEVPEPGDLSPGDTVDLELRRAAGRWHADEVVLLDPD